MTDGPAIIGDLATVALGVRASHVLAGANVTFGGHIEATRDCRIDPASTIAGDVLAGEHVLLGPNVQISGQLRAGGHIIISPDATVVGEVAGEAGTHVGSPRSVAVTVGSLFLSILNGQSLTPPAPLIIPRESTLNDDRWSIPAHASIGSNCRLHGNLSADSIAIGAETTFFGSLRADDSIEIGRGTTVHGDVVSEAGAVSLHDDAHVRGDIRCEDLAVSGTAVVDGTMRASGDIDIQSPAGPGN